MISEILHNDSYTCTDDFISQPIVFIDSKFIKRIFEHEATKVTIGSAGYDWGRC